MPDGDSQSTVVNFPSKAKIPHLYCGNVTLKDHHCKYLILSQFKTMCIVGILLQQPSKSTKPDYSMYSFSCMVSTVKLASTRVLVWCSLKTWFLALTTGIRLLSKDPKAGFVTSRRVGITACQIKGVNRHSFELLLAMELALTASDTCLYWYLVVD